MTKNRFLSKRLACLLTTTALLTTSLSNSANSADIVLAGASAGGPAVIDGLVGTDAVTVISVLGADNVSMLTHALTLTLADAGANQIFGTIISGDGKLTITSVQASAGGTQQTIASFVGTDADVQITTGGDKNHTVIFTGDLSMGTATGTIIIDGGAAETTTTVKVGGNVTGVVSLDDNTGSVIFELTGANKTINQAINAVGDNEGTLKISGAGATITDNVGTPVGSRLAAIDVNATATFSGNTEATTYTVDADTTFTGTVLAGTSFAVATTGTDVILTAASTTGTTTLASGTTVTANGVLTAGDLTNTSGKVFLNVASNVIDNIILVGTAELHIGKAFVTTNNINTSGTSDGEGNFASTAKIYLPSNLTSGETLTITDTGAFDEGDATKTAITTAAAVDAILQDTALVNYSASAESAGATVITITATDRTVNEVATQLGTNNNKATAAFQLMAAMDANDITGDTAAYTAFDNALKAQNGLSATEDTALINQTSPQTDTITGSTIAAKAVTSGVQNVISTRLASLRSGDAYSTGIVTGNHMGVNSGFIQAFGSQVDQKNKGNEFGYDADTTGFAIGFDTKVPGGAVIGISYAHSEADVDGKGTGRAKNDIKTDSVSLYADYATKDGYVEGSITYGKSDNKGSRIVNTAGLNRTYNSNYDGEQYSFRLSGGIPQSLGGGAFFTPFAAATISQIKADAYTETSTTTDDALRLRVAQDTVDSQVGTVGVKFHQAIKDGKTTFTPEVKLAINQEFGDGNITTTNTYQGGGASFKNSTAIEKTSATAGLGLNISSDNVSFNIGYEADVKDKYLGHSAQAKLTAKF